MYRKDYLATGHYYHVFSRSIAGFILFDKDKDFDRFIKLLDYYQYDKQFHKFSKFIKLDLKSQKKLILTYKKENQRLVKIIAFCVMPTHIHLLLKQEIDSGISEYIRRVLDSYSRFFNIKHRRKGPLWEGKFRNVLIDRDEQLLHLTRYIHLNPTSANLVKRPEDWLFSSYVEYINKIKNGICDFRKVLDIDAKTYQKFVNDRKNYQQELSKIKKTLIDNYTG